MSGGGRAEGGGASHRLQRAEAAGMWLLNALVGALILLMLAVTSIDVIGRYLFNRPLGGGFEVTEIAMALVVFAGLPVITRERRHIELDLHTYIFPRALQRLRAVFVNLFCSAVAGLLAWRVGVRGLDLLESGEATVVLAINKGGAVMVIAAFCVLTAVAFALNAVGTLARR